MFLRVSYSESAWNKQAEESRKSIHTWLRQWSVWHLADPLGVYDTHTVISGITHPKRKQNGVLVTIGAGREKAQVERHLESTEHLLNMKAGAFTGEALLTFGSLVKFKHLPFSWTESWISKKKERERDGERLFILRKKKKLWLMGSVICHQLLWEVSNSGHLSCSLLWPAVCRPLPYSRRWWPIWKTEGTSVFQGLLETCNWCKNLVTKMTWNHFGQGEKRLF